MIVLTHGKSRLSHYYKWYSYKWYLAHQMVVPQVILNFKWSSSKAKVPSQTRTQVYQVDDPCYDIGVGSPPIGIKVKDPT